MSDFYSISGIQVTPHSETLVGNGNQDEQVGSMCQIIRKTLIVFYREPDMGKKKKEQKENVNIPPNSSN